jgi:hypothetical protein
MLAWRLVWRQGPRMLYHVRCLGDGNRGWVRAEFLRPTAAPAPAQSGASRARSEQRRPRARTAPRPTPPVADDVTPQAPVSRAASSRNDRPVACIVCGTQVHPYNLWTNAKGKATGCYSCHGRRP